MSEHVSELEPEDEILPPTSYPPEPEGNGRDSAVPLKGDDDAADTEHR